MALYIRARCWTEHTVSTEQILMWWLCISEHSAELNTPSIQNKHRCDGCVHQSTMLNWTHGLSRTNTDMMAVYIRAQCWTEHTVCPEQILIWWLCASEHNAQLSTRSVQNNYCCDGCVHQNTVLNWTHGLSRTIIVAMAVYIRTQCWTEHTVCPEQLLLRWLCTSEHSAELSTRSVRNKYFCDGCVDQSTLVNWTHRLSRTNIDVMAVYISAQCWIEHTVCPEQILLRWLCTSEHSAELSTRSVQNKY